MAPLTQVPERAELTAAKRAVLEARLRGRGGQDAIPRVPREEAPLSFAQERLWFLDRLQPGSAAYNIPAALRLSGGLDATALHQALGEVVRRHEALRTTFREVDGRPVQTVHPFAGLSLPVEDLSGMDPAAREAEATRRATDDAARPFDLVRGPPLRASLLRLGEEEHVLLLCLHHAVADGWSIGVLFREMSALYTAFRDGGAPPLAELPIQYTDYAVWQRARLGGGGMEKQLGWWRERLAGDPPPLALPTDRPRPAVQSFRGAHEPFRFDGTLLLRLEALAKREDATPYMVLLAGFQALLAEYAATEDVVVGSPVAGRPRREVEGLIGLFVNTVVLRTDLTGDPSFRALLARVRDTVLGALEHQAVPFERLVSELRPERSLSHSPLFQVLFALNEPQGAAGWLGDLRVGEVEAELATTKFDLSLTMAAQDGVLAGSLAYATDLFDRATIVRMIGHLRRLLEQVAADPDLRLSAVELAGPEERRCVVETWNATGAEFPEGGCVHDAVAAQVRRTPGAVALVHGEDTVTYAELERRAGWLAHRLRAAGVGPEVRVAVCTARGPGLVTALLATLGAGGAYVCLDPAYPAERLEWMLRDSGAAVLLADAGAPAALRAAAESAGVALLRTDLDEPAAAVPEAPGAAKAEPENLAFIIYTSGSTGRPKGVAIPHAAVSNLFSAMDERLGAEPGVWLAVTSVSFDISVVELFWTLTRGFRVVLHDAVDGAVCRRIRETGATHFQCTPSLAQVVVREPEAAAALGGLRRMLVAGEALPADLARTLTSSVGGAVLNLYGPTETTIYTTGWVVEAGRPVVIGRPVANYQTYVVDAEGRPRPPGLPGELYVGGAGVTRGYLGRAALTAERFVPDPFSGSPGARLYRTGDRARWTAAGELDFLGRADGQVKVRGFRVEPGEVEAALRACPGVAACAVVAREDLPGQRRLVAYVVGEAGADALRERLRATLPEHMVPAAFVAIDALPRNPNGKLDRRALPAPPAPTAAAGEGDEPRSFLEARLLQLWEELLGVEHVGVTQGFFELGGDSLLALRLVSLVQARLGCELPVSTLFAGATVRQMADAIRTLRDLAPAPDAALVTLQPDGALPPLYLVHPADRGVMGYVPLVRHLGPDQPVYGLRDVAPDPARPLAEIAAGYVEAIRAAQPRGPYHLAGWSFGGFVAYEMAVQLERQGERAAFVGLLDTMAPALAQGWPWNTDADMIAALAADLAARAGREPPLDPEALRGMGFDAQLRTTMEALRAAVPQEFDEAALRGQCELLRARLTSLVGYVPAPFSGTLTLFRARDVPERQQAYFDTQDPEGRRTLGWSAVSPVPVVVHAVAGTHATLGAEPHVRELVPLLRRALAGSRAG